MSNNQRRFAAEPSEYNFRRKYNFAKDIKERVEIANHKKANRKAIREAYGYLPKRVLNAPEKSLSSPVVITY